MPQEISVSQEQKRKESLGRALGRIASGVYVVTVARNGKEDGMLTTWIQQISFEPPAVLVCVKEGRPLLDELNENDVFVVNVLSKKNMDIYKSFAKPFDPAINRFNGLAILNDCSDGPVFADCVAFLSCKVSKIIKAFDHRLVLGEVIDGAILNSEEPFVHLRSNGFGY